MVCFDVELGEMGEICILEMATSPHTAKNPNSVNKFRFMMNM
jgi:hypothetical protein